MSYRTQCFIPYKSDKSDIAKDTDTCTQILPISRFGYIFICVRACLCMLDVVNTKYKTQTEREERAHERAQ